MSFYYLRAVPSVPRSQHASATKIEEKVMLILALAEDKKCKTRMNLDLGDSLLESHARSHGSCGSDSILDSSLTVTDIENDG